MRNTAAGYPGHLSLRMFPAVVSAMLRHQQVPFKSVSVPVNVYGVTNHNTAYDFCQAKTKFILQIVPYCRKFNAHLTERL